MADADLTMSASALLTMLRREGGFWTVSQLVQHWQPTWCAKEVEQHLATLRHAGHLAERPSLADSRRHAYSARPQARAMPAGPGDSSTNVVQLQRRVA